MKTGILIIGGGTGGVAAALAAAAMGKRVVITEETDWLGGQFTSQAVPADEHPWIESFGCTRRYRALRDGIRQFYRDHYPLTDAAKINPRLNPGGGLVSKICCEPRVALAVIDAMLAPQRARRRVEVLTFRRPIACALSGDGTRVESVTLRNLQTGAEETIEADYVLDATELGDLLPMAKVEHVCGAESHREYGEPHGVDGAAQPDNVQAFTWCFAMGFDPAPGANHVIDRPAQYDRWRGYRPRLAPPWPVPLLDWSRLSPVSLKLEPGALFSDDPRKLSYFRYRQIVSAGQFVESRPRHDVSLVNWPQNDFLEFNVIDKPAADAAAALEDSKQLSLSLLYWMQTEAPRHDGKGTGYPGLHLVPELMGTNDGLAKAPYFRESRRIKAVFTITEGHVGLYARYGLENAPLELPTDKMRAEVFSDSVGIGHYRIDLHPSTGGNNYIDVSSLPFQIPLGALIPVRVNNLIPACKNIGTTHITNGCYRLHPVEWNIGEAAGLLAGYCIEKGVPPRAVRADPARLDEFQSLCKAQGLELSWPARA